MFPPDPTIQRILIIRPSALGDVSRTVPCLTALRVAYPDAQIDWIVRDIFIDVVRAHPDLNEVIPFPRNAFSKAFQKPGAAITAFQFLRQLKKREYDLVYDLQGLFRSGLFAWATGAWRKVGFANARELGWLGYTSALTANVSKHTVDQMVGLLVADDLPRVPDMRLYTPTEGAVWFENYREAHQLETEGYAVISPTSRWITKQWPAENFAAVARQLKERGFSDVLIIGSPGEEQQTRAFFEDVDDDIGVQVHDLVGKTSIAGMMAVLEHCGLLVCNDSAALHIAVGYGRRCVCVFGVTDPEKVGPYHYPEAVVRVPDCDQVHYRDMRLGQEMISRVSVQEVMDCVDYNLLNPAPSPTASVPEAILKQIQINRGLSI